MFVKNNYNPTTVAMRIKTMLKSNKKTQKELFTAIGMAVNTLDNYKKSMPKSDNLAFIADYLGCSVDYLLGRTDNPNISAEAYIGGDNNGVQAIKSGDVIFNSNTEKQDEMETELLKAFRSMTFIEKLNVMNFVLGNKNDWGDTHEMQ